MFVFRYLLKLLKEPRLLRGLFYDVKKPIIERVARDTPDFFFVQIGAHDGKSFDPIYRYVRRYGWHGLLVEPQEALFARLKENYQGQPGLSFERAAITDHDGTASFFQSPISFLGSLHEDEWFRGRNEGLAYENRTRFGGSKKITVPALTLSSLLKKHRVKKIDLLQIDTEGSDFDIVKQIPFESVAPRMIACETVHFDALTKRALKAYLAARSYTSVDDGWNILAWNR